MKRVLIFSKIILGLSLMIMGLTGCENYLDKIPDSDGFPSEEVFKDYLKFKQFEDGMYQDLNNYLSAGDYSYLGALSDEGYMTSDWETLPIVQNGDWLRAYNTGQALQFYGVWGAWRSIRIANLALENISKLEGATNEEINQLKGQAYFMRAWYYYEFLKRQGGMPYITKAFKGSDDFAIPRLSFHETALKIAADCDSAAVLLPVKWNAANIGRPEKGAAMAVKASALLFSASPTNNPQNEATRWQSAAQASLDILNQLGPNSSNPRYKLLQSNGIDKVTYKTPLGIEEIQYASGFDSIFMYRPQNDEIIWENYPAVTAGDAYRVFTVPSIQGGGVIQGYSPSANFVDRFETINGLAINDDSSYDSQNPYIDRDPRFYHTILFNGERWSSKSDYYLELFEGGAERKASPHNAYLGYMTRKFWGKNVDGNSGSQAPYTHVIYFRLADVLLQYAEAANEIGGPNYKLAGASLSAVDAVNMIRERVKMPPVQSRYLTDKNIFRTRIKNERAIELYLEGKRFFDLSRWGDASKLEHKQQYAVDFTENASAPTGYNINKAPFPYATYTFDAKHYRWPVPLKDALMFNVFVQNPGW